MPVSVARLRQWFVAALVLVCLVIGGTYLYLRHRVTNALKQVPGKIGIEIQQSAQGFTISKSLQGRTLFRLQASKAVQFKQGGRAELRDVTITLYGRDSSRFDQVYGEVFDYDPQSGNVSSKGEVSIDLQANPQGILHPDQTMPKELKNPIHLKTSGLVFNKDSGDAWTDAAIEFRMPQASGSAVGAKYLAKEGALALESQIKVVVNGANPATLLAERALLERIPRQIVLTRPHVESPEQQAQADELSVFLKDDNTVDHVTAAGNVRVDSLSVGAGVHARPRQPRAAGATWSEVTAQRLDISMNPDASVKDAVLSGDVHFRGGGQQTTEASAGRALLDFGAHASLRRVHAEENVELSQRQASPLPSQARQETADGAHGFEITAPAMDFFVSNRRLRRAETIGAPQISIRQLPASNQIGARAEPPSTNGSTSTRISADKFTATFDALGQISQVHGAANVNVVSSVSPTGAGAQPERITSSDTIDAFFRPGTGIQNIVQQGHFVYRAGTQHAFASTARYTPPDQVLTLSGSPRITDAGMETTANSIRLNRATGDGFAQGDVKTSYNDLKEQPNGAMLASSDPVHVTAQSMSARSSVAAATYTGHARLWQNANVIEAPSIQFEKERRIVIAQSQGDQRVSTVLVATDKNGRATPATITSGKLTYADSERKVHLEGGVVVRGSDMTITAERIDVFLAEVPTSHPTGGAPVRLPPSGQSPSASLGALAKDRADSAAPQSGSGNTASPQSKIDRIVASGSVVITEPNRRATGDQLTYTVSDDKFVLTGGPPSIFDAEHGKITAVSLTLFRRDGRVVVEGDSKSPAVTETKVVR